MSMTDFSFGDNVIDSRDVISRVEEHNDTYNRLTEVYDEALEELEELNDFKSDNPDGDSGNDEDDVRYYLERFESLVGHVNWIDNERHWFNAEVLDPIQKFSREGEGYPNWGCGTPLIHEEYFTEIIESGGDPRVEMFWNDPATEDIDAHAEEVKQDYGTIKFGDETYYLRV